MWRRYLVRGFTNQHKQQLSLEDIRRAPKVELHAHVTASIPRPAFQRLLASKGLDTDLSFLDRVESNEELFRGVFSRLSRAIQSSKDLKWVTQQVLEAFEEENVRYIELRSTAKKLEDMKSELQYVETILDTIDQWRGTGKTTKIEARYLLSLNRAYLPEAFFDALKQVKRDKAWSKYLTGLDYSGDPWTRDITDYRPCIELAREAGMKLSIHTGEFPGQMAETPRILSFDPERLGHFIYFTPDEFQHVKDRKILIESCPTSNLVTSPEMKLGDHPVQRMYAEEQLMTLCTDDRLIFDKQLSEEIWMVANEFGFDGRFLQKISLDAMKGAFIHPNDQEGKLMQQRILKEIKSSFY